MQVSWLRRHRVLVLMLCATPIACSSDDPELERIGTGPVPAAVDEPEPTNGGGAGGLGSAGAASNGPIAWCDALQVIETKCQRCHQEPPKNGAPMPLLTYEDTQAEWTLTKAVHHVMLDAVTRGFMPYVELNDPPNSLMPPVEPLTDEEKAALLAWLMQGALPEGGTDCP